MRHLLFVLIVFNLVCLEKAFAAMSDDELLELTKQTLADAHIGKSPKITRLLRDIDININETNAVIESTDIWYYPSQSAIQDYGYDNIYYNGFSEELQNLKAFTLDSEGTVFWFEPDDARTVESDTYNVFSNGKELIVNYAGLSVGSVTTLRYTITVDLTQLETYWSDLFYVQSYFEQKEVNINVRSNTKTPIYHKVSDPLIVCTQNNAVINCSAKNIPALDSNDTFYYRDQAMHVAFSQVNDWQSIANLMLDAYSVARSDNSSVLEQLPKLISAEMTTEEKISTIHQYVARDIRYHSESEEGNAYSPHSVSRTVNKKYGDCKDKTVLLIEMFQQIGIAAYPVLVSTTRRNIEKLLVPSAAYFDHVVMCFEYITNTYCIDATDTSSDWRYTSEWIQGHASLVLDEAARLNSINQDPHAWTIKNEIEITILENGGQTEQQEIRFKKAYASAYRRTLEGMDATEQEEYLVDLYSSYVSEGATPKVSIDGVGNLGEDIVIFTENTFDPYLDMEGRISVVDYEPWIVSELNSYTLGNSTYPYTYSGSKVLSVINVTLPENWQLESYPASLELITDYGKIERKINPKDNGSFSIMTTFAIAADTISVEHIENFESMISIFKEQSSVRFTARYLD